MKRAADHALTFAAIAIVSALWWIGLCWLNGSPPLGFLLDLLERVR